MRATAKMFSSSFPICATRRAKPSSLRPMIPLSLHTLIARFALWMARLRRLMPLAGESRNESLDVLQLYNALLVAWGPAYYPGCLLCSGCVMAIVALQLVGLMINNALTGNVRDANGGDIAVFSRTRPFTPADLSYFDQLKRNGTITNYTAAASATGSLKNAATINDSFDIAVVDPATFPVVTPPTFVTPSNGSISSLLNGNKVIVDTTFADQFNKKVGDSFDVHAGTRGSER